MVYKEVGKELPEIWKPEIKDECIEGKFIKKKDKCGPNESALYVIDVSAEDSEEPEFKSFWGSTVLDDKMDYVEAGDKIKVTYLGKEKNYHNYLVEKDVPEEEPEDK